MFVFAQGHLERCELIGEVKMRSFLPSSSQIKVKLNEDLNVTDQESPVSQRSETGAVFIEPSIVQSYHLF